jgi:hypothetical protein
LNFKIAIRSYNRPKKFFENTYSTLSKLEGIDISKIYVFVASEEQKDLYSVYLPEEVNIIIGIKGVSQINTFMASYFEEGENVLYADDDIRSFKVLNREDVRFYVSTEGVISLFDEAFNKLDDEVWAFTTNIVSNAFFCMGKSFAELRIGHLQGGIYGVKHKKYLIETKLDHLDDVERTLKLFENKKYILFLNSINIDVDYGKMEGGMQDTRKENKDRVEYTKQVAEKLERDNQRFEIKASYQQYADCWGIKYPNRNRIGKILNKISYIPLNESLEKIENKNEK